MQTIKFLAVLGVAAIGFSSVVSPAAPDTDEQAKLREVLRKSIEEQNAQEAGTPAAPQPVAAPTVVVPIEPETSAAAASQFSDVPVAGDDEAFRAALRQFIADNPAPAPETPAAAASQFSDVPVAGDDEATARFRAALRQFIADNSAPAPAKPMAQAHVTGKPAPSGLIPSPFSAAKQQRLDALLSQYKADAITPQEYHAQRAAIISAP